MRTVLLGIASFCLLACGGMGTSTTNDVATAAARVKSGVESQAPGLALTAQVAATAVATQAAGAISTVQAAATAIGASGGGVQVASQITDRAKQEAARALGVAPDQVTVEKLEQVQWRDSSLGCSEPGKAYAQVITPGVRVVLSGGGKRVEVHADANGGRVIVCQNPTQ